jgi:hypothetical protein
VVDRHVETIDVLPTLLELARVPAPQRHDGVSLLRRNPAQLRRVTIFHRIGTELNTVGGDYRFGVRELERRRAAAVRRKTAWFGSGGGTDPDALYRIGPHAGLIGRRAGALPRLAGSAAARLDQAADLRDVDPDSGFVPGEITGEIPGGREGGGRPIALVLNGRIAATGRTFSLEGSRAESFEVIVPESAFRRGANHAGVFEIVRRGAGPALRPL